MSRTTLSDQLDAEGWLPEAKKIHSPNFDARPTGEINLVVVHAISLPPGQFGGDGIEQLFTNQLDPNEHPYYEQIFQMKVSAHFLVRRNGEVIQFVSCMNRAWHAGVSSWRGRERCNDFSIGVELEGCDEYPFESIQYDVLAHLVHVIDARFSIEDVVGHADIAPGRKTDPGPFFQWDRLHQLLMDSI